MGKFIGQLGEQIATDAIGGIFGLALGGINDRRQIRQQQKLQDMQIAGQKEMGNFNYAQQMNLWNETNYKAQVEQLKKAGLNPGLLYGMGGAGGATTAAQSGNVAGASAPTGGGEAMGIIGMTQLTMAQRDLLKAQKRNVDADTQNKLTENPNIPLKGENLKADTENKITQNAILEIENDIKGRTSNMAVAMIATTLREATERLQITTNEKKISEATLSDQIKILKGEAISIFLKNAQTKEETRKIAIELSQKWEQLRIQNKQLNYTEWEAAIKQQLADYTTQHPNLGQVTGGLVEKIMELLRIK